MRPGNQDFLRKGWNWITLFVVQTEQLNCEQNKTSFLVSCIQDVKSSWLVNLLGRTFQLGLSLRRGTRNEELENLRGTRKIIFIVK